MAVRKVLIIGGGPAGYTAAIYAARANLSPLLISGVQAGGQLTLTTSVENYPGFVDGVQGPELMETMRKQAERFGTDMTAEDVTSVDFSRRPFVVRTEDTAHEADTIVIATGASWPRPRSSPRITGRSSPSCGVATASPSSRTSTTRRPPSPSCARPASPTCSRRSSCRTPSAGASRRRLSFARRWCECGSTHAKHSSSETAPTSTSPALTAWHASRLAQSGERAAAGGDYAPRVRTAGPRRPASDPGRDGQGPGRIGWSAPCISVSRETP